MRKILMMALAFAVAVPVTSFVFPAATAQAQARGCGAGYYRNARGNCVRRPVRGPRPPEGATARCRDGTYSYSQSRRGTCSWHGGVAQWL
jgi:hypothetical protein